ncbi:YI31B [Hepatospora eriocheir]|uniref:YI31B n=1 Tax=Hepatospora eriocheir TaxID=1081669 RepID=A0A1X0Q9K3_9MICR|nr:YI31B [Hepatospora eriocheir]
MNTILGDLDFVKIFVDDVLIYSPNLESHVTHVETVLVPMKNANITINLDKSNFVVFEVEYLGYLMNYEGLKPSQRNLEALDNIKPPRTVKDVMKLDGLIIWFRPFLKNLSIHIAHITDLTRNRQKRIKFYGYLNIKKF